MATAIAPSFSVATSSRAPSVELHQVLPSALNAVDPFVDNVMSLIAATRGSDGSEIGIEVALREALINAIVHGNKLDATKQVEVVCRCRADGEVELLVRDEGLGFAICDVPDPTTPENKHREHGRGIYMMRAFMDEVTFRESGQRVYMRKEPNTVWPPRSLRVSE